MRLYIKKILFWSWNMLLEENLKNTWETRKDVLKLKLRASWSRFRMQFTTVIQKESSIETSSLRMCCSQTKTLMILTEDKLKLLTLEFQAIVRVIQQRGLMQAQNDSCLQSYSHEIKSMLIQLLIYGRWGLSFTWYCLMSTLFKEMERYWQRIL